MAPRVIDPASDAAPWPVHELLSSRAMLTVGDLQQRFATLPLGAWDKPPREAVLAPIAQQGQDAPAGFLVAGINPYRRVDDAYLGFIGLVAGQLAAGLANAQAHEERSVGPMPSPSSTVPKPRSSPTSATNCARR
jgi:GAF domain-containing protein